MSGAVAVTVALCTPPPSQQQSALSVKKHDQYYHVRDANQDGDSAMRSSVSSDGGVLDR